MIFFSSISIIINVKKSFLFDSGRKKYGGEKDLVRCVFPQRHFFCEELVAVVVEGGDGVGAEVDREAGGGESVVRVAFEELEDAEAIDTLGAGVDEKTARFEILAQGLPKAVGGKLMA
jgi:hypothetical protein